jgi:AAA+ superfamily predicted ATPase
MELCAAMLVCIPPLVLVCASCLEIASVCSGDLDDAVLDRMDEALEFGLPGLQERQSLLALYMDK